jgi:hypothetical protein
MVTESVVGVVFVILEITGGVVSAISAVVKKYSSLWAELLPVSVLFTT